MTDSMKLFSVVATMMVSLVGLSAPAQVSAGQPPQSTPPPPAQLPFPPGATHAYVNLGRVAAESIDGQAANAQVQALSDQKVQVLEGRTVELQASQQKLQQNANVMSNEAQLQLQREIDRLTIDIQRMTQDAETEVGDLQQGLQLEFQQKLVPAIERVAVSKGLRFIFSAGDGGLIWAAPELDVTDDVIADLDKVSQETP
jgi:outer membrane protein